jgi:hypothetical protein
MSQQRLCAAARAPYAGSAHFVGSIPASPMASRWSARESFLATIGSANPKGVYKSRSDRPTRSGPGRQAMIMTLDTPDIINLGNPSVRRKPD